LVRVLNSGNFCGPEETTETFMADASTDFDLTRFRESTRRRLYERVASLQFSGEGERPTPDDAGLQVVYFAGRWWAAWIDLEEPAWQPTALRMRIARIGAGGEQGIELYDV
jgi:hypothetical protein